MNKTKTPTEMEVAKHIERLKGIRKQGKYSDNTDKNLRIATLVLIIITLIATVVDTILRS